MGIIRTALNAIGGTLADSWLEAIECSDMGDSTVFCRGTMVHSGDGRHGNKKKTVDTVSNGSKIHVGHNQFMILVDGGKVVDYTAEPGYYEVSNSSMPSLFNGQFGDMFKDIWDRIKFGGTPSSAQKVYFINLQEIKGIKFGTANPVNYFDSFYNAELFVRAHGTYSIKITNPLLFYAEAIPKNKDKVDIQDINEQYFNEFLDYLQSSMNRMSADGIRISYLASKSRELSEYMAQVMDEEWKQKRGMEVQSVGIGSISYDEESKKLIEMRNKGAMMGDPNIREGYIQSTIAEGINAAGSNTAGATTGFVGMGMGMNAGGGFMGAAPASNQQAMQYSQQASAPTPPTYDKPGAVAPAGKTAKRWTCSCGKQSTGKFCPECGAARPVAVPAAETWVCSCGSHCTGKFCSECGSPRPEAKPVCPQCGKEFDQIPKFCDECGHKF